MRRAALLLALFLILPVGADAAQTAPTKEFLSQLTTYFHKIAASFGCSKLGLADFKQPTGTLEFLPGNQGFEGWTRLFTATIFPLPLQESEVMPRMVTYRQHLVDAFGKQAKILDTDDHTTSSGLPVTYIEYVAGSGAAQEHAAGVFARHSKAIAAFTQIQIRRGALGDVDRDAMKAFAEKMTQQ